MARSNKFPFVLILLLLTCYASSAYAKTLYVDGISGNDSTSYAANGPTAPWRTIGRAAWGSTNRDARNGAEAARAGDTVIVAAGTYSGTGTSSRNEILYYNENPGTPGAPVVFRASGTVILTQTGRGALIGSYRRDYTVWDGFTIDENNALSFPDTGPVVFDACTGCAALNLHIIGNGTDSNREDNHPGIRLESSHNIIIRNNRVHNFYDAPTWNPNNGVCIQTYQSDGLLIENNELYNCGAGIFLKGGPWTAMAQNTSRIRYNYIHNIGVNNGVSGDGGAIVLHAGAPYTPQNPVYIYQNIIQNTLSEGVKFWPLSLTDNTGTPQYARVFNNTFHSIRLGVFVSDTLTNSFGHMVWNNIFSNVNEHAIAYNDSAGNINDTHIDFEHNIYFGFNPFAEIGNATRYTLATWKSTFGHDSAVPASQSVDPQFVNPAGGNFHLQAGSPARTTGVDFLDLNGNGSTTDIIPAGAYVTGNEVIGLTTAPPPTSPCDVNNDSTTNVTDVQLCTNQAIGSTACSTGDINHDGQCTVIDVQRVVNAVLGGSCVTQ